MKLYELVIDPNKKNNGVYAVSLVNDPAMESDWIALSKNVKLAVVDEDKRILMGAALIPNKPIYRRDKDDEYHVFFSEKTVRETSELFFKKGFQSESTLEHEINLKGNTVVESWIKEDDVNDKSVKFGIDAPIGSWIISMKIEDDKVYQMAKDGILKGFSIEGFFADNLVKQSKDKTDDELYNEIIEIVTKK